MGSAINPAIIEIEARAIAKVINQASQEHSVSPYKLVASSQYLLDAIYIQLLHVKTRRTFNYRYDNITKEITSWKNLNLIK
ncbi:MAG: hypothetical protein AAFQ41_02320 [Cyanobacteria bacterium J06623_7]